MVLLIVVSAWRGAVLAGELQAARTDLLDSLAIVQERGLAIDAGDATEVADGLASADASLARADDQFADDPVIRLLGFLPVVGTQLSATDAMVDGARAVTAERERIAVLLDEFIDARDAGEGPERIASLARFLGSRQAEIGGVVAAVVRADATISRVGAEGLIGPVASAHETLTTRLTQVRPLIDAAQEAAPVLPGILGVGGERRYLMMALDNAEIRPIGGLIAAYATPRFTDGLLTDTTFHDIGDIDRADQAEYVTPPDPLIDHLLGATTTWQVADAGWWPDFADSAAEARRMFEIETGDANLQGAIAFTPEFVDSLLEIIGPVEVPEAGITVPAGETYLVSLEQVEVLNRGEGRKQFLADLASQVLDRLFALPPERYPQVIAALDDAGKRRHLQMIVDDPAEQELLTGMGWYTPFTFPEDGDRLAIMEANVNPVSKMNVLVDMEHELDVTLLPDGTAEERLVTRFTNRYGPELAPELERVRSTFLGGFLGSFHRRYLDPDAEIEEVSSDHPEVPITDPGYVEDEPGGLSVGNYQIIEPGTTTLTTTYFVPDIVIPGDGPGDGTYRLHFFKQPGRDHDTVTVRVAVPEGTVPVSWSPGGSADDGVVTFTFTADFDRTLEVTFERR